MIINTDFAKMPNEFAKGALARWQDVPIKELDADTIKVYRKKVKKSETKAYAHSLLIEALYLIGEDTEANLAEGITEDKALEKVLIEASNLFVANVDFNRRAKILDLVKTAYALLMYVNGNALVVA